MSFKQLRSTYWRQSELTAPPAGPTSAPFVPTDWPNPRRTAFAVALLTLVSVGVPPADAAVAFNQTAWPNPQRATTVTAQIATVGPNLLATTLAPASPAPFVPTDWPNPTCSRAGIAQLATTGSALLSSTLAATAPAPFAITDWPNPTPNRSAIELRTYVDPSEFWLLRDQMVSGQTDWPNPVRATHPVANRTFLSYYVLDDSLPFTPVDLTLRPALPSVVNRTWTSALLQSTLAPAPAPPVVPIEFANPRVAARSVDLRTYIDPSEFWLLADQFFGAPGQPASYDATPPLTRLARPPVGFIGQSLLETTLVPTTATPAVPIAWPNPVRLVTPIANRNFVSYYVLDDSLPFTPVDFPLPVRRAPSQQRASMGNLLESTLAAPAAAPFVPVLFPNPSAAGRSIDLRTYVDPSEVWLLKDQFFGDAGQPVPNYDWPNPRVPGRSLDLRTVADASEFWLLQDTFYGAPGQPPAYDATPNPRRVALVVANLTTTSTLLETTLAPTSAPFVPTDVAAIIARPRSAVGNLTVLNALLQTTLGSVPAPFVPVEFANPRAASRSIDLRTFTQAVRIQLIGKDLFFGAAGETKTYDWTNPRRRVWSPINLTWLPMYGSRPPVFAPVGYEVHIVGVDQFVVGSAGTGLFLVKSAGIGSGFFVVYAAGIDDVHG